MEATGFSRWFERLLGGTGFRVVDRQRGGDQDPAGEEAEDRSAGCATLAETDAGDRFLRIWAPSLENRDLRQLLWHRRRLVSMRTRITNQLRALAMNEGRRSKRPWSEAGRAQLEKLTLAPWASRRRQELLELLDQLHPPRIEELTAVVEQEARKRPEVLRLMTHPGVGTLTALAYV